MESSPNYTNTENKPISNLPKTKLSKKVWVVFILIDVIIAMIAFYFLANNSSQKNLHPISVFKSKIEGKNNIIPTPFPFQEITVPYLRTQEYNSSLEELIVENQALNYTSYVTSYKSDGFKINGLLTRPAGAMPTGGWPAIVFVHGYIPPAQYATTGEAYSSYVDYLASRGFVVFKIDLRGHGDSEGEAGGGYFGSDYIVDTLNAYSALQNIDFVNPKKIGMWGHSMAGNVLLRSVVVKQDIPAVSIWAGAVYTYTDREKYGINDSSFQMSSLSPTRQNRRRELIAKYGEPSNSSEFWRQVIPTNYLNDIKGAIQLNHAVDDSVVDIGYSRDLDSFLDRTSVPHELNEYPSGGHDLEGSSFVQAMDKTVLFFEKYLN